MPIAHTIYLPEGSNPATLDFLGYFCEAKPIIERMGVKLRVTKVTARELPAFRKKHQWLKSLPALVTPESSCSGAAKILEYYDTNISAFLGEEPAAAAAPATGAADAPDLSEIISALNSAHTFDAGGQGLTPGARVPGSHMSKADLEIMKEEMRQEKEEASGDGGAKELAARAALMEEAKRRVRDP